MKKLFTLIAVAAMAFAAQAAGEEPGITLLSEANALEDAAEFTFDGDAVVTVYKNGYLFLRDESGYGMIAGVDTTLTFANGQVLNQGWTATKTSVNDGWVRYIDAADLSASGEANVELAAAQKLTAFPDESMLNAYVYIENVKFGLIAPRLYPLPDGTTINRTEELWGVNSPANLFGSKYYNVYGVICKVDGELTLCPVDFVEYVAPPAFVRGDVNGDTLVGMDDLALLISYLLDPTVTINQPGAASCNDAEDTQDVNMDDLAALITYLLANSWD